MPKPEAKESLSDYVGRFMQDPTDRKKWKPKQRAAIAYKEFAESKKKQRR